MAVVKSRVTYITFTMWRHWWGVCVTIEHLDILLVALGKKVRSNIEQYTVLGIAEID